MPTLMSAMTQPSANGTTAQATSAVMKVIMGAMMNSTLLALDGTIVEREAMLVAVGNGVSYGGGMKVTPGAVLDDGEFAITVLKSISKLEFLRVFPRVYSGSHVEHPAVEVYSAKTIELAADGMTAYADGERFGTLPITAECVPGAWRVLAPPSR